MQNVNPETGIRYGIISANSLDPEVIDEIQQYGHDIHWQDHIEQLRRDVNIAVEEGLIAEEDFDEELDLRIERDSDHWMDDEPVHSFELQGVHGRTTWLGGALMVWVFESPHFGLHALCSPCVPNCGDLDSPGDFKCYDVPDEWRNQS